MFFQNNRFRFKVYGSYEAKNHTMVCLDDIEYEMSLNSKLMYHKFNLSLGQKKKSNRLPKRRRSYGEQWKWRFPKGHGDACNM